MMKRREGPIPGPPPPVDRAEVRALVTELHDAHLRGGSIHATPTGYALAELASVMAYYYTVSAIAHPEGPRSVDTIVGHILRHAPSWLAQDAAMSP
jgi:hypothetical protein